MPRKVVTPLMIRAELAQAAGPRQRAYGTAHAIPGIDCSDLDCLNVSCLSAVPSASWTSSALTCALATSRTSTAGMLKPVGGRTITGTACQRRRLSSFLNTSL